VELSLYLSAATLGDKKSEETLYTRLKTDPKVSDVARGYFIAYYSDDGLTRKRPPYTDKISSDGEVKDISRVIHNLAWQFSHPEKYYYAKRVALTLILEYIKYRKSINRLHQETVEKIVKEIKAYDVFVNTDLFDHRGWGDCYSQKVRDELNQLLNFCNTSSNEVPVDSLKTTNK